MKQTYPARRASAFEAHSDGRILRRVNGCAIRKGKNPKARLATGNKKAERSKSQQQENRQFKKRRVKRTSEQRLKIFGKAEKFPHRCRSQRFVSGKFFFPAPFSTFSPHALCEKESSRFGNKELARTLRGNRGENRQTLPFVILRSGLLARPSKA